jgi:hypothetical protein
MAASNKHFASPRKRAADKKDLESLATLADQIGPEMKFKTTPDPNREQVNHPKHYGGDTPYEAIKVIEAWELDFCLGNTVKYISRAGKKDPAKELEDLKKARWYLDRKIKQLKDARDH